ncbi:MAG TPA: ABC transporter ATP-binding protein [Thermoanaerobaculia bacterium]|nr:ABC transporter ATP-binding protein [Thermoanaerobaculia bacterium]
MSIAAPPALELSGLTKRFGEHTAVDRLDLTLGQGELFCFLGPNGAGKTTTIKMITGLVRPSAGAATVGGCDIQSDPIGAKRRLGYVPDHPYLYERLTCGEMMRFVGGLYRIDAAVAAPRIAELLETFEIAHVANRLVSDLSHGMRQKLSFACCFLHAPSVVVVDEPWVGLDPKNIRRVKDDLVTRTRRDGLTVFMSTHSLAIAEELADRVGIIHRGRLLRLGTVADVKALAERPGNLEDVFLELTRDEEAPPA